MYYNSVRGVGRGGTCVLQLSQGCRKRGYMCITTRIQGVGRGGTCVLQLSQGCRKRGYMCITTQSGV